jgi:glycosyltransferase involved in cell wall biosynthesis
MESWRGTIRSMRRALDAQGCVVSRIETGPHPYALPMKGCRWVVQRATGRNFAYDREPAILREWARRLAARVREARADVVLSPGSTPIACLESTLPIVFWTDAVFAGMLGFYPSFCNLTGRSIRNGNAMEQAALDRCAFAVYTSDWAAEHARALYRVDPDKIRVQPFGAAFAGLREDSVENAIMARSGDRCVLLFPSMEWERKGGDIALDAVRWLNQNGQPAELRITGNRPPVELPAFARYLGRVSREQLEEEFASAHFIILPTRADCAPSVFNEASAYATPSLATDVGGVSTLVRNGRNGQLFPPEAKGTVYGEFVKSLMADADAYRTLARSSYQEFRTRLNWTVAGKEIVSVLDRARVRENRAGCN